jgi:ATP-binding cassette subfamily B multidrug efflux pump
MLRLLKYLKPYLLLIVLDIVLLFVQANADLALPDYMSKIVNVGIQQGGIANAVPQAILKSEMDKLLLFMSAEDQATVLADYTLVDQNSPDYEKYLKTYPALEQAPIYVLNSIDKAEMEKLNSIMAKPLLTVSVLEQAAAGLRSLQAPTRGRYFHDARPAACGAIFQNYGCR